MRMPSLVKYFAVVGSVLLGLLLLVNHLFGPADTGKVLANVTPKIVVKHDPHASAVERWRNEQAALKAAAQTQTAENASLAAKSELAPPPPSLAGAIEPAAPVEAAVPEPAQAAAPEADRTKLVEEQAKLARIAKAKERKARIARQRAKEMQATARAMEGPGGPFYDPRRERSASNQQDQYYYNQRGGQRTAQGFGNAFAPQPSFGPFGGFGRGW